MKKHIYILLTLALFGTLNGISQNSGGIDISYETTKTDSIGIQGDTLYDLTVVIFVMDTSHVAKVKLKIGSNSGGADVFDGVYDWNNNSLNRPLSSTYSRLGSEVKVEIKKVPYNGSYFKATTVNSLGSEESFVTQ